MGPNHMALQCSVGANSVFLFSTHACILFVNVYSRFGSTRLAYHPIYYVCMIIGSKLMKEDDELKSSQKNEIEHNS